ncbi:S41 family peptidase [Paenibacillus sp. DMB5]|uniref:S41 family peptidase n=1 Tax=Paenibacillus sp. DMB5 TaxID=1780103 RepID=UPI00076C91DB|nr:S41 family peptidase [Paenibacillus sp. DMB5]KUP24309.1 hypothetical protein AWJ19_13945 [Paenibacillus sp. DMB5]
MQQDLDFSIGKVHPSLINGWSSGQKQVIESAYSKIGKPQSDADFYFTANEIVSLMHDGHTVLYWELENLKFLDLSLFWARDGLVVNNNRGNVRGADQDDGVVQSLRQLIENDMKTDFPYKGKPYLLTSPQTFSSANMFAVIVQDNGLGQIIGEATGNQPSSYGDILTFQLPASGIHFQVSFK